MPKESPFNKDLLELLEIPEVEPNKEATSSVLGNDSGSRVAPAIYKDKHGLPVTYDAATEEQKKNRADGLSMLWHELLSPLTVIKGYTSTLLQLNDAITEDEKIKYIQGIESATNRMIRFMENLRDLSRLEEPDSLVVQRVSMPDLLRTVIHDMQNQTTKHFLKIRSSHNIPLVSADPEKIEQVLNNLLTNAMKYSPDGGDIAAEVQLAQTEKALERISGDKPPIQFPCIIVSIADSGIGIPETETDKIFQRFYRIRSNLTRAIHGAGLGLYICKIIVEAHDGHIWARNQLQGGSVFYFSIPIK
jgi:signal transduction histidine kinase